MQTIQIYENPNEIQVHDLIEIYNKEDMDILKKNESLNRILNMNPPEVWVKKHPYAANHKYIPIDKVEYLMRKIFKKYRIEITGQGVAFNGVWVTVRVHYLNPASSEWDYHDGIGACELQTKSGSSPADLANVNKGALAMAFPIAKTTAVKDACDHFGSIFGANLNRKDVIEFQPDNNVMNHDSSFE